MEPSDAKDSNEEVSNTCNNETKEKKFRKRKRHYYNSIRSQMEFYLGDSNVTKDRFLRKLLDVEPYVPLETFLSFNKLKALTSSVDDIAKALTSSKLLQLDETKTKVCRINPIPEETNVDNKTLYVESLPSSADHDWVKKIFQQFGNVTYVSLPKFKKSRKIKEFGFVEFDNEKSVEKAIEEFKKFNGVLDMSLVDPGELKSIIAFDKEKKEEESLKENPENSKKRRHSTTNVYETEAKRSKTSGTEMSENESSINDGCSSSSESEGAEENEDPSKSRTEKTKRRKKSSKAKRIKQNEQLSISSDPSYLELKILPKIYWKRLRNKYLNLQREKIAELKKQARNSQKTIHNSQKNSSQDSHLSDNTSPSVGQNLQAKERKLTGMHMNFYGAGEDENCGKSVKDSKANAAIERVSTIAFEPGLIIEVKFLEPCCNIKEFKADMRQYNSVKYVDIKEGAVRAFLRLETPQAARDFICQINCANYQCHILGGDAENEYWRKIENDREMKLNKQVKLPQKRGREKIKKLLNNHIRFKEEEE